MGEKIDQDRAKNNKYKDGVNKNARLSVRNVSFKATEDALKDHFSQYGIVEEVKLLKRSDGKLVGCGFVHFTQVSMANKAIKATNKKPFLGRPLYVTWAVPKHKFTENITEEKETKKRTLSVSSNDEEDNKSPKKVKKETKMNRKARLVVRNISFQATEDKLKSHFEQYGTVLEVNLLKKPDGKLVGCAFLTFKNVPMAKEALVNTNMKPFLGRPISVDWAVAKDKYMQHIVNQELAMQEDVKKEDADSDDDGLPINISGTEVKDEVKSESDKSASDSDSEKSDKQSDDDSEDSDEEQSEDEDMEDDESVITATQDHRKRIQLNDAEDGCTVFVTNIPFSVDNLQLQDFAERTGEVKYALICMDKMTEHSKGTGFIKFCNKSEADKFLSLPPDQLRLEGQIVQVKPALKRENLQKATKKQPKDNRNLYLVKEGVIKAGSTAAEGVSVSDMAKRTALERSKTQMLKNLNRFVSRIRIVVSNLPPNCTDTRLRSICVRAAPKNATITEARVMRDLRATPAKDGKHPSKGYGFVMFTTHEDALTCLRKLNNNPEIFDKNNRPIVSFSIEDRAALNARKKRLEKSIANNPLANKNRQPETKQQEEKKGNEKKPRVENQDNVRRPGNKFKNPFRPNKKNPQKKNMFKKKRK